MGGGVGEGGRGRGEEGVEEAPLLDLSQSRLPGKSM